MSSQPRNQPMMHYSDSEVDSTGSISDEEETKRPIKRQKATKMAAAASSSSAAAAAAASGSDSDDDNAKEEDIPEESSSSDDDHDDVDSDEEEEPAPVQASSGHRRHVPSPAVPDHVAASAQPVNLKRKEVPAAAAADASPAVARTPKKVESTLAAALSAGVTAPSKVWGEYGIRMTYRAKAGEVIKGLPHGSEVYDKRTNKWHVIRTDMRAVHAATAKTSHSNLRIPPPESTTAHIFSTSETENAGPFTAENLPVYRPEASKTNVTWVACDDSHVYPLVTKEACDLLLDNSGVTGAQKSIDTKKAKSDHNAASPISRDAGRILFGGIHHVQLPWAKYYAVMETPSRTAKVAAAGGAAAGSTAKAAALKRKRSTASSSSTGASAPGKSNIIESVMVDFYVPDMLRAVSQTIKTSDGLRAWRDAISNDYNVGQGDETADLLANFDKQRKTMSGMTPSDLMQYTAVRIFIATHPLGHAALDQFAGRMDATLLLKQQKKEDEARLKNMMDVSDD